MLNTRVPRILSDPRWGKIRIAAMVLAILVIIEIATRIIFLRPDLVTRNAGKDDQATDYLIEQIQAYKGKGRRIVFLGSSVMQGYLNAFDDRAFPFMAEKILRKKYGYTDLKTFNLAAAGNTFADNLCILNRVLPEKPDLIVHSIHFKLFSTNKYSFIARPKNAYYLSNTGELGRYLKRFDIGPKKFAGIFLDRTIARGWAFYRNRGLITHLLTGADYSASEAVQRKFHETMGFLSEEEFLARLKTPEEHNMEYLWKLLPEPLVRQNFEICGNFNFTETNPAWLDFTDENRIAHEAGKRLLWYLTPMNKPLVQETGFFNWEAVTFVYKENIYHVTRRYRHKLVDYSMAVEPAFFSDTDHVNMKGHRQLARRAAKDVHKELKSRRRN